MNHDAENCISLPEQQLDEAKVELMLRVQDLWLPNLSYEQWLLYEGLNPKTILVTLDSSAKKEAMGYITTSLRGYVRDTPSDPALSTHIEVPQDIANLALFELILKNRRVLIEAVCKQRVRELAQLGAGFRNNSHLYDGVDVWKRIRHVEVVHNKLRDDSQM